MTEFDEAGPAVREPGPGVIDSTILVMDGALALLGLARAEAVQALQSLPAWLGLSLYRLPALLLTWISLGVLVACGVYEASASLVFAAGSFFALQLGLTLVLERRARQLRAQMEFRQTRLALTQIREALQERFGPGHEAG